MVLKPVCVCVGGAGSHYAGRVIGCNPGWRGTGALVRSGGLHAEPPPPPGRRRERDSPSTVSREPFAAMECIRALETRRAERLGGERARHRAHVAGRVS